MIITLADKFIAWLTLFCGLTLSAVAIYYSVAGLVSIFAAAVVPIIIMGTVLELSKLVATVWLKQNWHIAPKVIRAYLIAAIFLLMFITSMGIFGYLSKAHMDQTLISGDVISKIALFDEKIKTSKENIDANRRALKQLDEAVDQVMGRSTTESGAERSVQIRRQQSSERQRLLREIETEQKKIIQLNEERTPIAAEVRKVEAEVGPIKYIAALIYGDNIDTNLLESAVRWVIIIIVIVFDPLAVILILASQYSFSWFRQNKHNFSSKKIAEHTVIKTNLNVKDEVEFVPKLNANSDKPVEPAYFKPGVWFKWRPFSKPPLPVYLTKPWIDHVGEKLPPQVFKNVPQDVELLKKLEKDNSVSIPEQVPDAGEKINNNMIPDTTKKPAKQILHVDPLWKAANPVYQVAEEKSQTNDKKDTYIVKSGDDQIKKNKE